MSDLIRDIKVTLLKNREEISDFYIGSLLSRAITEIERINKPFTLDPIEYPAVYSGGAGKASNINKD